MLMAENIAALAVFAMCGGAFALGYALRRWVDDGRAEWADTFAYRSRRVRNGGTRTAFRRLDDGRR